MENKSPILIIEKLVLVGIEKQYIVNFDEGINIIYGDSDTGKSSILNIIDYLLGAKKVYLYDEIEQYGRYGLLQVNLNGKVYTIKRDIFDTGSNIEVYPTIIEEMDKVFPEEYGPHYGNEGPSGYFSDFLISSLNIPIIKVKKSPTKENSEMVRLSFRDIFKYCYFDQDEIGNRYILNQQNYAVFSKNKETFKFLHNVLDTQIVELQHGISEKVNERKTLNEKYKIISSFLRETKLLTEEALQVESEGLLENKLLLEKAIKKITLEMQVDGGEREVLREIVVDLERKLHEMVEEKTYIGIQLDQNIRLRKDYNNDVNKLQLSLKIKDSLNLKNTQNIECPLCNSFIDEIQLKEDFIETNEELIKKEIRSIKNRLKGLDNINVKLREEIYLLKDNIEKVQADLQQAGKMLDINSIEFVSPFIKQRDIYISELSSVNEKLNKIEYFLKIRNQLNELEKKNELLGEQIDTLNNKLEKLKESTPSIDLVLDKISTYIKEFLEFIPIRNAYGISISDKKFLPIVRDRDYSDLTSGGLRTLTSIGYIISLFKNSLLTDTHFPSLIMLDTVGKYLGKTKKDEKDTNINEDKKEQLDDPSKYVNIYKFLDKMSISLINKQIKHQIIIVDNDFPNELEEKYMKYVVKRFSVVEKDGFERGFINNATSR
ncbi:AAA family ATPase [Bacillus pseudomycoides]|uniref:AAA family ATPase n=1 Tax=Bacillus pseudomycoides TaxID=64104 RepID=UPI000BEB55CC|nr:AAA family ATPase [Bacillus pseudomycoides]PEA82441.1 hypothetical protein CON99_16905 [Bacillus pseudomycoides]PED06932.1 hypothetical protein COO19_18060 [Bacillus pseudomycoides]PED69141.1 hypothetical protein CON97_26890 [Bacillus pseudomycoides]PEI45553.1 hypothetical protein CN620_02260 [Bacillus pseudomycoides]PEI98913.1 hypothetical protein CN686_04150 [Bacillus pseudomycoides]